MDLSAIKIPMKFFFIVASPVVTQLESQPTAVQCGGRTDGLCLLDVTHHYLAAQQINNTVLYVVIEVADLTPGPSWTWLILPFIAPL